MKVMIPCIGREEYFDKMLVDNLDVLKQAVMQDWDGLLLVFGREGVGKSTFALQLASYLDEGFNLDRVCWTAEAFVELCLSAERYSCIVLDEAYLTFANRSALRKLQSVVTAMLTTIRDRNLFLIVVSPTIFDLSKYLVVSRALVAIRCYHHGLKRGFWEMYGEDAKLRLYVKGRRDNDLRVADADIRGRFTKWLPIDADEYKARKRAAVDSLRKEIMKPERQPRASQELIDAQSVVVSHLRDKSMLRHGAIAELANYWSVNESTVGRRLRKAARDDTGKPPLNSGDHSNKTYEEEG